MLIEMQKLALCYLWNEINGKTQPEYKLWDWFINEKNKDGGKFFPYLVEPSGKLEKYYTLKADTNNDTITILESADIGILEGKSTLKIPFNKPSGPRSAQLGPVIKRSYDKKKGAMPQKLILNNTIELFKEKANSSKNYSNYFNEVVNVLTRSSLFFNGNLYEENDKNAFEIAIEIIPENQTVYLTFLDSYSRLPGDVPEYREYLFSMLDADSKYTTAKAKAKLNKTCPLCNRKSMKVYSSACSAAGINFFNMDRDGAFPGLSIDNAHLSFAICADCADLLYVFKFYVVNTITAPIAGHLALILPDLSFQNTDYLMKFYDKFNNYVEGLAKASKRALIIEKKALFKILLESRAVNSINIIWVELGQKIENISGIITDILPSRLSTIQDKNDKFVKNEVFYPKHLDDEFSFDLSLSFLSVLLKRPGGEKAKAINKSKNCFELKRLIAEAVYKKRLIPEKRFWEEIMITAKYYITNIIDKDKANFDLFYEGFSPEKNEKWLTLAGWVKHLLMTLNYFCYMEVMKTMKNTRSYEPKMVDLQPYFQEKSGINSDEKAFTFILGILYGRLMMIQGGRGVNVGSNSLTWLKRLTLNGKDLPELYVKIREKLLAYDAEGDSKVRELIGELGRLGNLLGDNISIEQTPCCYFLLLGQSMTVDLFPKKNK